MKNSRIIIITIIIFITIILIWISSSGKGQGLVRSGFIQNMIPVSATPTPVSNPTPKTLKFDSSTDLKEELKKVNPQVLDSDFQ